MATTSPILLNILSVKILKKYRPRIVGVFESGDEWPAALMIKQVLEKRHIVQMSSGIVENESDMLFAILGMDEKSFRSDARALGKAISLVLRRDSSYPSVILLRLRTRRASDMKKILEVAAPDVVVFAGRKNDAEEERKKSVSSCKALLLRSLKKNNLAVLSSEDEAAQEAASKTRCLKMTFGFGEKAAVRGEMFRGGEMEAESKKGASFKVSYGDTFVPFHLPDSENRNDICAALAAAAVGLHFGSNLVEISEALRK